MAVTALALVQLLGAALALALAAYAYRRRDQPGITWLVAVLVGDTVWMVAAGVNYASSSLPVSTAMLQVRYVGITVVPVALLFFAMAYTGYDEWLTRRHRVLIALPAIGTLLVVLTDGAHGGFYASVTSSSNPQHVAYEYGVVAVPWIVYAFVLVLVAVAVFIRYAMVADHVYRWQALALAGAISMGIVADVLYFLPVPPNGFAITPLSILLSSAIAVGIILRFDFVRLIPATRELGRKELIERMELGMVVLNADGRVVDVNPAAARIVGRRTGDLLGERAPEELPDPDGPDVVKRTFEIDDVDRDVEIRTYRVDGGSGVTLMTFQHLDDFPGIISHDLQGPLMEIRASADLAITTGDITHVDRVLNGANRIDELVTDLLRLDRIGHQLETRRAVDLADLADTAWTSVWSRNAELVVETDRTVMGDPNRVQQLFENLFRNSVEHGLAVDRERVGDPDTLGVTDAGENRSRGRMTRAGLTEDDSDTVGEDGSAGGVRVVVGSLPTGFFVEDDGPGVPPEARERVFEKGYTDSPTGSGLGLSIVRQIAYAHGWSVRVTEGPLGGARFEITDVDFVGETDPDEA